MKAVLKSTVSPAMPGHPRIMKTDHGPHPVDLWAQVTTEQILSVGEDMTGARRASALALQARVQEILTGHHGGVEKKIKELLSSGRAPNVEPHPDQHEEAAAAAASDIIAAAEGTEWGPLLENNRSSIEFEIARMFASHDLVVRQWHGIPHAAHS